MFTPISSTIWIHPKRWYAYGGEHRTFNAVFSDVFVSGYGGLEK
jgi:hypothetical protein